MHRCTIALVVLLSVLTTGCGAIQPTATMLPPASATPLPLTPAPAVLPSPTGAEMSPEARAYLDQALLASGPANVPGGRATAGKPTGCGGPEQCLGSSGR